MAQVFFFDKVKVLQMGITGPQGANQLFIVTGVAVINFTTAVPDPDCWTRVPLGFLVPDASGNPLSVGFSVDAACIVYPTAIASANSQDFGWAVDSAAAIPTGGDRVEVVANLAIRTDTNTILFRIGFHVSILAQI